MESAPSAGAYLIEAVLMTCSELQQVLPFIIESGGTAEEKAHLRECPSCASLVADLSYIAAQARSLLPMQEDPDPSVWEKIESRMKTEGLGTPRTPPDTDTIS